MTPAGWQADPTGRHELRYFDGTKWTEHVSDQRTTGTDPLLAAPPTAPAGPPPEAPTASFGSLGSFAPPTPGDPTQPSPRLPPTPELRPEPTPFTLPLVITESKPVWKRWWFLGGLALLAALIVVAVVANSDDDDTEADLSGDDPTPVSSPGDESGDDADTDAASEDDPGATTDDATSDDATSDDATSDDATTDDVTGDEATVDIPPTSAPSETTPPSTAPTETTPPPTGELAVGMATTVEGNEVRVNTVTPNAPADEFFTPDPGITITEIEIEACAGDDGFQTNSFSWTAFLDDNTVADNALFGDDLATIGIRRGGCARGTVQFEVPDGRTVASVVLQGGLFQEVARWQVDGAVAVTERLRPTTPPESAPVGETIEFGAGHSATVRTITDDAPPLESFFPPDEGRQFTRVDVELCAGSEPLSISPFYWAAQSTENWVGSTALLGDTLPAIDVAPGECAAGAVELDFPAGSTTGYVMLTSQLFDEVARWSNG